MATVIDPPAERIDGESGEPPLQVDFLRRRAVRGGALALSSRLLTQGLGWAVTIAVARFLRPYDYGVFSAGMLFFNLGDVLAEAGMGRALVQKADVDRDDLDEVFTFNLGLSLLLYPALFLLAGPAARWLQTPDLAPLLRVFGLSLLLTPFRATAGSLLDRRLEMGRQSAIQLGTALFQGAVVLSLAFAGFGFWALAGGLFLSKAVHTVLLVQQSSWRPRLRRPSRGSWSLLSYGANVSASRLCLQASSNSDYAVVGGLLGAVSLGHYSLAFSLVTVPVAKVVTNCSAVMFPVLCRLQHEPDRLTNWFARYLTLVGFVSVPLLVGLALTADDAVPLALGRKWAPSVPLVRWMTAGGLALAVGGAFDLLFNALGRPEIVLRYYFANLLIYPPVFYAAGIWYGALGVAAAWACVTPLMVLALIGATRPITGIGVGAVLRSQGLAWVAAGIMGGFVLAARAVGGEDPSWGRFGGSVLAGVVGYAVGIRLVAWRTLAPEVVVLSRELRGGR